MRIMNPYNVLGLPGNGHSGTGSTVGDHVDTSVLYSIWIGARETHNGIRWLILRNGIILYENPSNVSSKRQ